MSNCVRVHGVWSVCVILCVCLCVCKRKCVCVCAHVSVCVSCISQAGPQEPASAHTAVAKISSQGET